MQEMKKWLEAVGSLEEELKSLRKERDSLKEDILKVIGAWNNGAGFSLVEVIYQLKNKYEKTIS